MPLATLYARAFLPPPEPPSSLSAVHNKTADWTNLTAIFTDNYHGYDPELEDIWDVNNYGLRIFGCFVMVENLFVIGVLLAYKELCILSNAFLVTLCLSDFLYASTGFISSFLLDSTKVSKK